VNVYVSSTNPTTSIVTGEHGTISECVCTPIALTQTAPRQARRLLDGALAEWGLGHLADAADLIVSELVTNAFAHGTEPAFLNIYTDREADAGLLFVEVEDAGELMPVEREADRDAVGGRGLQIVAALADDWGYEPVGHGKRVWASLPIKVKPESEDPDLGHGACPCGYVEDGAA
jgi:anti-sigma regulatory factor (Ser/Thr protein kinase)